MKTKIIETLLREELFLLREAKQAMKDGLIYKANKLCDAANKKHYQRQLLINPEHRTT